MNEKKNTDVAPVAKKKGGQKGPRVTVEQMLEKLTAAGGVFKAKADAFKATIAANADAVAKVKASAKDTRKKVAAAVKAIAALS